MADPTNVASSLLSLVTFAFKASITLYTTVQSFKFQPRRVRDLNEQLEALSSVLSSLAETVTATTDVDLSVLELPLLRCGNACNEFDQEILKCSLRSGGSRSNFRDWAKLRYMGDDIDAFVRMLAGYNSTINIALTDVNLRRSSVTAEELEVYKDLLKPATDDLEAHLQSIDEKLEMIVKCAATEPRADSTELQLMQEERSSAQKCLQICTQLSNHIDRFQFTSKHSSSSAQSNLPDTLYERLTEESLQECKESLASTATKLERLMRDRIDEMVTRASKAMVKEEDRAQLSRVREEWETARQCMDIFTKAEVHLRGDISTIDNYATGDAVQFMVSNDGKTIYGKNRGLGWRTRQVGGHLSDTSIQQLSRDMSGTKLQSARKETASLQSDTSHAPDDSAAAVFTERYGPGFELTPKSLKEDVFVSTQE